MQAVPAKPIQAGFTLPPSPDEVEDAEARAERDAERERRARELREKTNLAMRVVPPLHSLPSAKLIELCQRPIAAKLAALVKPTLSAVFLGPTGVGKSTAAACLVRRAAAELLHSDGKEFDAVLDLHWTTAAELADLRWQPLGEGKPSQISRASQARALVLDDVGLEDNPGLVVRVLQARYERQLPTIATSGLTPKQLTAHLGSGGVRRLNQQHAGFPLLMVDCHAKAAPAGR